MAVPQITEVSSEIVGPNIYLRTFRVANASLVYDIETEDLAVGSNALVADSTAAFLQWDGMNWNEVM